MALTKALIICLLFVDKNLALPYGDENNDIYSNADYEDVADTMPSEEGNEQIIYTMPKFVSKSQNLMINEGSTIKLPCILDKLEGFVLLWRRGEDFISVGKNTIDKSNKRRNLVNDNNGNTLIIHNAELKDEGDYVCQVSSSKPIEIKHEVKIRVKPEVRPIPDNGIIVAETGDSVTLGCEVMRGSPAPEVRWHRKERKMPDGEDTITGLSITFTSVTRHHSGIYTCEADNGFGQPTLANLKLDVQHKPEIEQEETFIHTVEGDKNEVNCIVHSSPKAQVSWFKDGEVIDENGTILINQRGNRHTLTIPAGDTSKFGKYTCRAQNQYGEDEKTTEVSGLAEIAIITSEPKGIEDDRFLLEWTARSLSTITHFKIEYKMLSDSEWKSEEAEAYPLKNSDNIFAGTHMISNLKPETVYLAKVSSRNVYGYSNNSQVFKFATKGADPVQKPITGSGAVPLSMSASLAILCSTVLLHILH